MKGSSFLDEMTIAKKIVLMLSVPLLALLFYAGGMIQDKRVILDEMGGLDNLSHLELNVSSLIHELQKERGMIAGFIGSGGKQFKVELTAQKFLTDSKFDTLNRFLETFDKSGFDSEFTSLLENAMAREGLGEMTREEVEAEDITVAEAITFYSDTNKAFLDVLGYVDRFSSSAQLNKHFRSYYYLQLEKEDAGLERAVLSGTFAADRFAPGLYEKFIELTAEQNTYYMLFNSIVSIEGRQMYLDTMRGEAVNESDRMRQIAIEKGRKGGFGVDSTYWFWMQTGKIDKLGIVSQFLADEMMFAADSMRMEAETELIRSVLIALFAIVVATLMAVNLVRNAARRRRAEEKLLLLGNMINHSSDAIYIIEPSSGRILDANETARSNLGYSREELLQMTTMDIQQKFPDQNTWDVHVKQLKVKGYRLTEGVHKRKDGTTFPVEASLTYHSDAGMEYILAAIRDITKRKKNQEELVKHTKKMESALFRAEDVLNSLCTPPNLIPFFEVSAPYRSVRTVGGGDIIRWLNFRSKYAAVYLHDVAGHDIQEILLNILGAAIADMHKTNPGKKSVSVPSKFFQEMNNHLYKYCENTPDYLTAVYALMDYENGEIAFSLAGHPKPWLIGSDGVANQVGAVGSLLGQFKLDSNGNDQFEDVQLVLEQGQSLLLYSDGLMEQEDKNGVAFEENFSRDVIPKLYGKDPGSSYTILKREFESHLGGEIPDDDVSFIFISSRPAELYETFEFVPGQRLMDMTRDRKENVHGVLLPKQRKSGGKAAEGCAVIDDLADAYLPVLKKLKEKAWPLQMQKRVEIVLREMIVNAIMHGNLCSDNYSVKLHFVLHNNVLEVSVSDEGKGFDGTTLSQSISMKDMLRESGRGLYIVGLYADHMYFNEAGNQCWALFKKDEMTQGV